MNQNVPDFVSSILFSDEANFYVTDEVNRQNVRYWSNTIHTGCQTPKFKVRRKSWFGAVYWVKGLLALFFIHGNLNANDYLDMLKNDTFMSILDENRDFPAFFQQVRAPPHYSIEVCQWLDQQFPGQWTGRHDLVEWPPRSPDLISMNFYL